MGDTSLKKATGNCGYTLIEQGTNRYASLEMAQAAALPYVVQAIVEAIREGLENGQLVVCKDGDQNVVRIASPEAE
jgi:hypothetical protein